MAKRLISVTLCLLLLAALVPFSALSAETPPETASAAYRLEANTPLMNSQATGITNNAVYKIRGYGSNYYITLRNYNISSPSNTRSYDTNLNNVEVDTNTSLSDQEFRVVYNSSSDTYYIKAIKSADGTNRHLDVLSANASQIVDGKNIHIYAPGDENSSQWLIVSLGNGIYKIVLNYNQNLAITRTSGNNVQVNTYTGSSSQKWTFEEVTYTPVPITTNSIFRIKDLNSGLYVSVPGNDANLSNVALAVSDSSSVKQKFKFVYDTTNDVYYIKAMMSSNGNNRLLDVNSTASQPPVNGRNVHIYTAGDFNSSAWLVDDINGSGLAKIYMNYNNHLVLTAASGGTTAGTNIQVNNYTGEAYQKWILEPVDVPVTGIQLNKTDIELIIGQTFQLTASFSEYGAPTNFTWSVISGSGVTVSSNGLVSANAYGSAVVRASITYNGVSYYANCTVKVGYLASGTYYLRNVADDKYADIYGPSMNSGTQLHIWDFHGGDSQKYTFTLQNDGYYLIKSVYSNLYVAVENDSTNNNAEIKQYSLPAGGYAAAGDGFRWRVYPTTDKAVKIMPKTGENTSPQRVMASATGNWNGTHIQQRNFEGDLRNDEWYIYPTTNTINLQIEYDGGYVSRYNDYNNRINTMITKLRKAFVEYFDIDINVVSISQISSYADLNCNTNHNSGCNHLTFNQLCQDSFIGDPLILENLHHKNIYNNIARFELPSAENTAKIVFFGHKCCTEDSDHSLDSPFYGITYTSLRLISITDFVNQNHEIETIVHEFGHLYSAPDHYNYGGSPSTDALNIRYQTDMFNSDCIYGENNENSNVINGLLICDGCRAIIEEHKEQYND